MSRGITQKAVDRFVVFRFDRLWASYKTIAFLASRLRERILDLYYVTATKFGMATQLGGTRFYGPTTP